MCIIIDANRAHKFNEPDEFVSLLIEWISRKGKVVAGGKLLDELQGAGGAIRNLVAIWRSANKLSLVNRESIERETLVVLATGLESDDEHIIALARVSGARLVFTDDTALMNDFRSKRVMAPPGKIYTTPREGAGNLASRRRLLQESVCG